ncbi:isochorismatase family cysteine hydrolase [Streptomyces sp. cg40]|uniref:isochorismatase family cysteine hydrolase n=1 Tax=Streptomyces sp. cg40 TaxID=3419764 RepID=UPI003D06C548
MPLTTIDPTPALVVIDLQKGIVSALAGTARQAAATTVDRATRLATEFRRQGLPVVLVNVTGRAPGRTDSGRSAGSTDSGRSAGSTDSGRSANSTDTGRVANSPAPSAGWADLVDELDVRPTDHLLTKRRRSAFHDTGLDTLLRDLGATQIVLAGVSTGSGVESTARSASDHGYHVVLATDAMTDPDPEAHRHSVERVFPKLGETATTAEVVAMLEATR